MVVNRGITELTSLGFSEYEARVYIGLLPLGSITAYELSKSTGVPSSKIYEVLQRLVEKEAVITIHEAGRTLYHAQEPEVLIKSQRASINRKLDDAQSSLDQLSRPKQASYVWNIRTYQELMQTAKNLIEGAESQILLSAFEPELELLGPILRLTQERGVNLALVHFGQSKHQIGTSYYHPIEDTIAKEHGGRTINLVVDRNTALTSVVLSGDTVTGAWSKSKGFVILAEDYIKHDIYITKIAHDFNQELIEKYGENYRLLRDVFTKETMK